ncbi:N-acetyltransferase [Devosia pacifica]|uniref:N-acetyltransferase n=2 Tax=Devosia pacifica TaxID=1335967 RepID=A0A918SBY7_9HYPH|nr:N-acetyltransferase [Devosia pacifica]
MVPVEPIAGLVVREASPADLPVLAELWSAFEAWLNAIADPEPVERKAFDRFEELAFGETPLCRVLLAELDGEAVGYLVYYMGVWMDDLAPCLHVADLFVETARHGSGIGSAMMAEARKIGISQGAGRMMWTVWRQNSTAELFYRSLGAERFDEEVLMHLPLPR